MGTKAMMLSDKEIEAARESGRNIADSPSAVVRAEVTRQRSLALDFRNGAHLDIPLAAIRELADATDEDLNGIVVSPLRDAISVPAIDVDIYVPGLVSDVLNSDAVKNLARRGGATKTHKKAAAARANGNHGGRPKKNAAL